ncbi:MAG: DUF4159 domain-containing protein [Myxococcales bacterium]|jgi:hypothetical protein|nr:DUF4159 domain-containing protein [Myxococcales bacterium]
MDRRAFLKSLALTALGLSLPGRSHAFGQASQFIPAVARHGGDWDARIGALRSLCWEIASRTNIRAFPEPRPVALASKELFGFPFLYMGGSGEFPPLRESELANLRRFLTFGGFLLADANDGSSGSGFDRAFRREATRLFPDRPLARLPSDHVAFKSFYLLDRQAGRLNTRPFLEALLDDNGRALIVYSQNDLAGAFQRDELGEWAYEVSPGGPTQRELAVRVAVNLAMYATCLDYKSDMLHLPFLMKRRR